MLGPKCLYLGLGVMGYRIAGRLAGKFPTSVWNRTTAKATAHAEEFSTTALPGASPFDSDISDVNVILSCLPTSNEVMNMAQAAPDRTGNPLVWIDNTSGEPEVSLEISKVLEPKGVHFIDAPVSGGRVGAAAGTLTIMAGGPTEAFETVRPVLEAMGTNIIHLGDKVGTGHAVKGLNNMLFASNLLMAMKCA